MRPPHCAGEIDKTTSYTTFNAYASMRPPHCAGEIGKILAPVADIVELQ